MDVAGGRLSDLQVAREQLLALLSQEADGSKAAALSRELRAVNAELESLVPAAPRGVGVDEIAKRRAARVAASGSD